VGARTFFLGAAPVPFLVLAVGESLLRHDGYESNKSVRGAKCDMNVGAGSRIIITSHVPCSSDLSQMSGGNE